MPGTLGIDYAYPTAQDVKNYLTPVFLPKPQTPNPKPQTPNPKPQTHI